MIFDTTSRKYAYIKIEESLKYRVPHARCFPLVIPLFLAYLDENIEECLGGEAGTISRARGRHCREGAFRRIRGSVCAIRSAPRRVQANER